MTTKFRHDEVLFTAVRAFIAQVDTDATGAADTTMRDTANVNAAIGFDFGGGGSEALMGDVATVESAMGFDFGGSQQTECTAWPVGFNLVAAVESAMGFDFGGAQQTECTAWPVGFNLGG
eukprot:5021463-Amphidinium_carterae.1